MLRELTCHMGSHSVTCHPTEMTLPPLISNYPIKLVLDSAMLERCKAELTWLAAGYIPRWYTCPKMVTHPSTNWTRCKVTLLIHTTMLELRHANKNWTESSHIVTNPPTTSVLWNQVSEQVSKNFLCDLQSLMCKWMWHFHTVCTASQTMQ